MPKFIKIGNTRINVDRITHYKTSESQNEYSLTIFLGHSELKAETSNKAEYKSWLKLLGEEE